MGNFQIKMVLLVLSLICAGCTTPFVEVKVNGEDFSRDGGGDCWPPCWGGGGASFGGQGQEARILSIEKNQEVYVLEGPRDATTRLVIPSGSQEKLEPGDRVLIKKDGNKWSLSKK